MVDLFRAWRHIYRYVLGLVVMAELAMLWSGPEFFPALRGTVERLVFGESSAVLVLAALGIIALAGSIVADLLIEGPVALLSLAARALSRRRRALGTDSPPTRSPTWSEMLLAHPGLALQRAVQVDQQYLERQLRVISQANVAKERGLALSDGEAEFFREAIATILASKHPEQLWWTTYAAHYTQERRELDGFQTEAVIARSASATALLGVAVAFRLGDAMSPQVTWVVVGLGVAATAGSIARWLEARRKVVYYMLGLILQQYMWGEQGDIEDRDAV